MNLKIPGTLFFTDSLFELFKKKYLQIFAQFFPYSHFQILKKHTYESQTTWHNFFPDSLFDLLKKNTYKSWHHFLLIPFFKY